MLALSAPASLLFLLSYVPVTLTLEGVAMFDEGLRQDVFRSQRESALVLAERIGTLDELLSELMVDVLSGFDSLLAKHAAFDAYYVSTRDVTT